MRIVDAFNRIEAAAGALGLRDENGERICDLSALAVVSRFSGAAWQDLDQLLRDGMIEPEEYLRRALALIDEFGRARLVRRLDQRLADLAIAQRALGII